jgi:hypothetical protein
LDIDVIDGEIITQQKLEPKEHIRSQFGLIKAPLFIDPTTERNPIEEKLAIGAPLDFSANENILSGMAYFRTQYG